MILQNDTLACFLYPQIVKQKLVAEGFQIVRSDKKIVIIEADEKGAMYGILDIAEQIGSNRGALEAVIEKKEEPRFAFRAIKFNLPIMAYRSSISLTQQDFVIHDLRFSETFLDMMAKNRFNVISLWSMHPYHYMIRAKNFPEACPFDDKVIFNLLTFINLT